jgi:16S rRNA (cytidine1402-2'-O)-methyltransferase
MAQAFGPRRHAVICRELTKTHEEVIRGPLTDLAEWASEGVLGEITLLVHGAEEAASIPVDAAAALVRDRVQAGSSRKDAISAVAAEHRLRRRELYDAVVRGQRQEPGGR